MMDNYKRDRTVAYLLTWLLSLFVAGEGVHVELITPKCPCSDSKGCISPAPSTSFEKEVFAFTAGLSNHTKWNWKSLTTVITTDGHHSNELMCYVHSNKRRYGFKEVLNASGNYFDTSSHETANWIEGITKRAKTHMADVVALDLVELFRKHDSLSTDPLNVTALVKVFSLLRLRLIPFTPYQHPIRMICIVPWKPPCVTDECSEFHLLKAVCDFFMLSPDSYTLTRGLDCKATATIPLSKMALGVDEYISQGLPENRLVLGVPWHGFDYTCEKYTVKKSTETCELKQVKLNNITVCDYFDGRRKIDFRTIIKRNVDLWVKHNYSQTQKAPYYNYKVREGNDEKWHQVWFEDIASLKAKYLLAHDLELKGVALFNADDMTIDSTPAMQELNSGMWNWVLHDFLTTDPTRPLTSSVTAGTVAGAAIGCLLAGILLGVVFTCLAVRKTVRKPQDPFVKDDDEYHDDPQL